MSTAYNEEVYAPYETAFRAYEKDFDDVKQNSQQNLQRLLREVDPSSLQKSLRAGNFADLKTNDPRKVIVAGEERDAHVLVNGTVSNKAIRGVSDMLQVLSLEDGSIDEYLSSEVDIEAETENVKQELEAARQWKKNFEGGFWRSPEDLEKSRTIDQEIETLENKLNASGEMSEDYVRELKALKLKQFMQQNLKAELNEIASQLNIQPGTEEYAKLAESIEADTFGASLVGSDYLQLQQAFAGTSVAPDMFKFIIDDNNAVGHENSWWEDAGTSWSMGVLELEKQVDALDVALGVNAQPTYTSGMFGSPVLFIPRTEEQQAKRETEHLEKRKEIEAEQYKLSLQMTQYAVNAKTWELFGEDSIMSDSQAMSMGMGVKEEIGKQVIADIERTYSVEAVQSLPTSLTLMAPALLLAPVTGGMSAAGAFAVDFAATTAFTTAMVGSDRYYATMLDPSMLVSEEDRFWHSFRYGLYEGAGEGVGMGTFGLVGKFARLPKFSPFMPTGASGAANIAIRSARGLRGLAMGAGIGIPEEMIAEWATGFSQGFDEALTKGASYQEAFLIGKEQGAHGANVGKYMGLLPVGSVLAVNTKAAYMRAFKNQDYNSIAFATARDQFLNDQIGSRRKDKIIGLRSQLSDSYLQSPTKKDREVLQKIEVELGKIDTKNKATAEALEQLGSANPALVADMLITNNYHQFLENVRIGGAKEGADGRLRDFNGRFVARADANPFYDFVQNMSEEERGNVIKAYRDGGKRIAAINAGMLLYSSKNLEGKDTKVGVDSFTSTIDDTGADWRSKDFDGVSSVTIRPGEETDLSSLSATQKEVVQKILGNAQASGQALTIVFHSNDASMAYAYGIDEADVRGADGVVDKEGIYYERTDGSHEIHIHNDVDANRVIFHEYGHFFLEPVFRENPELVYNVAEQIRELASQKQSEGLDIKDQHPIVRLVAAADMQGGVENRGVTDRELVSAFLESMAEGQFVRVDKENPIKGFKISDLGVQAVVRNLWSNVFGAGNISTDSDLINLVLNYKIFVETGQLGKRSTYTTESQVESAVEQAEANGEGLSSKRADQILVNTEIFWTENSSYFGDRPANIPELSRYDKKKAKVFNNYGHFANWYRKMTGNGKREGVIRDIHYFVDGKRFNLNYPKPALEKDGTPKVMAPILVPYKERKVNENFMAIDSGVEIAVKRGGVAQTISSTYNQNFKNIVGKSGDTFALDFHSFKPEFDGEYMSESQKNQSDLEAMRNMTALMMSGVDLVEVHAKAEAKAKGPVYILNKDNAPELFEAAKDYKFLTREESDMLLLNEAENFGVQFWQLLPDASIHRKRRVNDPSIVPEDEMVYATIRLEEIKQGADFIAYENKRGLRSERLGSSQTNIPTGLTAEYMSELATNTAFAKTRHQALREAAKKLGVPFSQLKQAYVSKALLYDRSKHGTVTWPIMDKNGKPILDENGNQVALTQEQFGGPLGAINSGLPILSSHIDPRSVDTMKNVDPDSEKFLIVDIALRAPENTLKSPMTIVSFISYMKAFYEQNAALSPSARKEVRETMIEVINDVLQKNAAITTSTYIELADKEILYGERSTVKEARRYAKIGVSFNESEIVDRDGIEIVNNAIKVKDEKGLIAFLEWGSRTEGVEGISDEALSNTNFEARGAFIKAVSKGMNKAGYKGFLSTEQILDIVNDPKWSEMGDEGTGKIVVSYVARTQAYGKGLLTRKKISEEGVVNGFPQALYVNEREGKTDVVYAGYEMASSADHIYKKEDAKGEFGRDQQQSSVKARGEQGLKSRRLAGRLYTEGNSEWEKSTATPFGERLAYYTRRLQDKYSDVMLLQQDIEKFRGEKVPEYQDFEMSIDLFYGKVREDMELLEAEVQKIGNILGQGGRTVEELSDLLYAMHAAERNKYIKTKRPDLESGSGMTDEEAELIINELGASKVLSEAARVVYALIENTRQTMIEGGLESKNVIDHWNSLYKRYVPLSGMAVDEMSEESNLYPTGGGGFSVYGKSSKSAKGRKSRTGVNIVASVVSQNMAIKQRARKDEAMRSLYNLAKQNPNENVWRLYSEKAPMTKLASDGSQQPMSVQEMKANRHMVPLRINGDQHFIYLKDMSHADALNGLTDEEAGSVVGTMGKYVSLLREFATVYNPAFFITNYARDIQAGIFNAMAEVEREGGIMTGFDLKPAKFAKDITTTSLKILRPLIKDGLGVGALDPELETMLQEWKQAGGRTGWSYSESLKEINEKLVKAADDPKKTKQILNPYYKSRKFFELIEGMNEAFENAIRFSAYIEARKAGATKARAAQLSKNITVNFNRAGEASASYNSMYLFFNAAAQSAARFTRSAFYAKQGLPEQNGKSDAWQNRVTATQKLGAGIISFEILKAMFNIAMSGEGEDGELYYNALPDYVKERYSVVFYGDGPDDYVKFPVPYGYNIFNNLGLVLGEVMSGQRSAQSGATFLGLGAMNSFSPLGFGQGDNVVERIGMGFLPTALRIPVDLYANKNFVGNKILKEQYPFGTPVPEWTLAYRSPEWMIAVAEWTNSLTFPALGIEGGTENISGTLDFNPDAYWYLMQSYTAGFGKTITQTGQVSRDLYEMGKRKAERLANVEDLEEFWNELTTTREEDVINIRKADIPFVNILYGSESKFYSYDKFYENINELGQYMAEVDAISEKMRQAALTNQPLPETPAHIDFSEETVTNARALQEQLKLAQNKLDVLRQAKRNVRLIEDYIERTNAVHQVEEAELSVIKQFNKIYYELRGEKIDPKERNTITNFIHER